jgi:TRAP-type mannitol/chloroaromatic compound transport system permease large subunit
VGALVLAALYQRLSWKMLQETSTETIKVTAMVFAILVGATAFSTQHSDNERNWRHNGFGNFEVFLGFA